MKKLLLLLLLCLPIIAGAKNDTKYLEGAIQFEENRITFTQEIEATGLTKQQIYDAILSWANNRFQPNGLMNPRVLFNDPQEGSIAVGGEEWIVFSSSALSLDRSRIYYQLLITCSEGKALIKMSRIRYWYDEARNGGEKYNAEEWITDKMGLNKTKTKLAPICGKFRRKTIDLKEELFESVQVAIEKAISANRNNEISTTQSIPATLITPATPIKANSLKEKIEQAMRITLSANGEQFELEKSNWVGFDQLFGKEMASFLLEENKKMGNMLLEQNENYTIRFYQAGGEKPTVVIECKKLMVQSQTGEEAKIANPNRDSSKNYNMYIGEIIKLHETE
ncbi:MAG: DUF4468 domain-containing protein [Phocaeicola sp.]